MRNIAANRNKQAGQGVEDIMQQMTLAEKIGQMTQVEKNSISPQEVTDHFIGSVLSGGGGNPTPNTAQTWTAMVHSFQEGALRTRLKIPMIYGVDAVHGHNNVVGATIFPHNIGLGATRDEQLVTRIGRITAKEVIATGVHWAFAPCVAVPQDIRWGRIYEGYGENTELVSRLGAALVHGLQYADGGSSLDQRHSVLASVKHYVGDGGTRWGSTPRYEWIRFYDPADHESIWRIDHGVTEGDEATLRALHLPPYQAAIEAGALNIMVSYSSWGSHKMHAHRKLLTDVLKGEMGFSGFLVSDWDALVQLGPDYHDCVVSSINAGLDMIMVPFDYRRFIKELTRAVKLGEVTMQRIDDAVRRILRVKFELGLFERPFGDEGALAQMGSTEHRALAREAVRKSAVLLKNENQSLPLPKDARGILVAGAAADDIGLQCGGWTIEWMGKAGDITPGTTLLEAIKQTVTEPSAVAYEPQGHFEHNDRAEIGVVVIAEAPYAEGVGDRADLRLPQEDVALIERVRPLCQRLVIVLYSGRPLILGNHTQQWDALVAAWLPGSEAQGLADVLFGDAPFSGKLSFAWPRSMAQVPRAAMLADSEGPLFPYGYGLTT